MSSTRSALEIVTSHGFDPGHAVRVANHVRSGLNSPCPIRTGRLPRFHRDARRKRTPREKDHQ
jgi:hypothetical protein